MGSIRAPLLITCYPPRMLDHMGLVHPIPKPGFEYRSLLPGGGVAAIGPTMIQKEGILAWCLKGSLAIGDTHLI